jgi:hypothetical protein
MLKMLKSGHFTKSRLNQFADDSKAAKAAEAGGLNDGLTVKTRCLSVKSADLFLQFRCGESTVFKKCPDISSNGKSGQLHSLSSAASISQVLTA